MTFDKKCEFCGEVKDWKAFTNEDAVARRGGRKRIECRDCYRERVVHARYEFAPGIAKRKVNDTKEARWSDFLEEIERIT